MSGRHLNFTTLSGAAPSATSISYPRKSPVPLTQTACTTHTADRPPSTRRLNRGLLPDWKGDFRAG